MPRSLSLLSLLTGTFVVIFTPLATIYVVAMGCAMQAMCCHGTTAVRMGDFLTSQSVVYPAVVMVFGAGLIRAGLHHRQGRNRQDAAHQNLVGTTD